MLMKHLSMWGGPPDEGPAAGLAEDLATITAPTPRQAAQRLAASFSRRERFAAVYIADFNGKAAGRRAGFPPRSGGAGQAERLKGADVRDAIARRIHSRFERVGLTPDRVLREVRRIAYSNLEWLYRPDGSYRSVAEIDDDTLGSVHWIDIDTDRHTVLRVRRLDKVKALDLLGRHNGLWGRRKGPAVDEAGLLGHRRRPQAGAVSATVHSAKA